MSIYLPTYLSLSLYIHIYIYIRLCYILVYSIVARGGDDDGGGRSRGGGPVLGVPGAGPLFVLIKLYTMIQCNIM